MLSPRQPILTQLCMHVICLLFPSYSSHRSTTLMSYLYHSLQQYRDLFNLDYDCSSTSTRWSFKLTNRSANHSPRASTVEEKSRLQNQSEPHLRQSRIPPGNGNTEYVFMGSYTVFPDGPGTQQTDWTSRTTTDTSTLVKLLARERERKEEI